MNYAMSHTIKTLIRPNVQKLCFPMSCPCSVFTNDLEMSEYPLRPQGLEVVKILLLEHARHIFKLVKLPLRKKILIHLVVYFYLLYN